MPLDLQKIVVRRKALKLSQKAAGERAGMPQPHWARIEAGERPDPRLSTAERIALALKCPLAKLLA